MSNNILSTGAGTGFGLLTVRTLLDKRYAVYAGIRDPEAAMRSGLIESAPI